MYQYNKEKFLLFPKCIDRVWKWLVRAKWSVEIHEAAMGTFKIKKWID
jgi:hypothetical protein